MLHPPRTLASSRARLSYEQTMLRRLLKQTRYDVIHFPDYQLPIFGTIPRAVITVHDLTAFRVPETFPTRMGQVKRYLMARSVRQASHIVVPSHATRDDLIDILHVDPARVTVIYHGVSKRVRDRGPSPRTRPYFLAVGTIEPRKNLVRLIQAYSLLKAQHGQACPDLVIAGKPGWLYEPIYRAPEEHGVANSVVFLNYVQEDQLLQLYSHAVALCYPSLYEGFGLPMIEAMMVETPVVASDRGSLKEIGKGVAFVVDPLDHESIASGMAQVLEDSEAVADRTRRGHQRIQDFTWEQAARKTRDVYVRVSQR
jgi:glycosyltransferase involved in cell wall biosynthesis